MQPSTLPRAYYASETIYRQEIERLFCERWLCIGREEQVPGPGDFFVQAIGEESVIVVRGQDRAVRAFYNVCRHRGSLLCTQAAGQLSGKIECPYHAWAYSLEGGLIGAPHMRGVEGFARAEYSLRPVALESCQGLLFASLAAAPPPLAETTAAFARKVQPWGLPGLRSARRIEYKVRANWKLLIENYSDCYHCRSVHPELNALSDYRSGENDLTEGALLGGYMTMNRAGTSLTLSGNRCGPVVGEINGEELSRVYYYSLFPNLLISLHPDYVMLHTLWPRSPDRTHVVCEWLFAPAALTQREFQPEDAIHFWDQTNRQDWEICEVAQQGVRSRSYTPGPACPEHEELVVAFDREVLKALGHAAWSEWQPEEYLREYYQDVEPDERFLLEFLVEVMREIPPLPLALDFGCGPTVHRLFPLVPRIQEFHLAEYLAANRGAVTEWLAAGNDAHDWGPFARETLRLEGDPSPSAARARAREQATRERATQVLSADANECDPLGPVKRGFYPLVTTHYCADSATSDRETWRRYMRHIGGLVQPGGHFIVSSLGGSHGYRVGPHWFPGANITEQDVRAVLQDTGFTSIDLRVRAVPDRAEQGYSSVIFAHARKAA